MDLKVNLTIITKNHAADSKIGYPLKSRLEPIIWTHESNPTACELNILPWSVRNKKSIIPFSPKTGVVVFPTLVTPSFFMISVKVLLFSFIFLLQRFVTVSTEVAISGCVCISAVFEVWFVNVVVKFFGENIAWDEIFSRWSLTGILYDHLAVDPVRVTGFFPAAAVLIVPFKGQFTLEEFEIWFI